MRTQFHLLGLDFARTLLSLLFSITALLTIVGLYLLFTDPQAFGIPAMPMAMQVGAIAIAGAASFVLFALLVRLRDRVADVRAAARAERKARRSARQPRVSKQPARFLPAAAAGTQRVGVAGAPAVFPAYPENWADLRQTVLRRDGNRCGNCGGRERLQVHHIVPLSRGGSNQPGNLRTLCYDCHARLHPHMRDDVPVR